MSKQFGQMNWRVAMKVHIQKPRLTEGEEDRLLRQERTLERCFLGLAEGTRNNYRCQLRFLDACLRGRELTDFLLARYLLHRFKGDPAKGIKKVGPGSLRSTASAVRWRAKVLDQVPPIGPQTKPVLKNARREGAGRGRGQAPILSREQIEQIAAMADATDTAFGSRDSALISLGFFRGMRVSELAAVRVEHLTILPDGSGRILIPRSKTDQSGQGVTQDLPAVVVERIQAWMSAAGITEGALFRGYYRNAWTRPTRRAYRMTPHHCAPLIRRRGAAAGFKIKSHTLRRSFANWLSEKGVPTYIIAKEGRWKDIGMVMVYTAQARAGESIVLKLAREKPRFRRLQAV